MSDSVAMRCLRCGAPDVGDKARCVCGASLLVDVVLKVAVEDERRRFELARAIALLGPPAPAFSVARVALAIPGNQLVQGAFRPFAEKLLAVLSAHGASAALRPAEPRVTPPRRSSRGGWVAVLGLLVLGGGVAVVGGGRLARVGTAVSGFISGEPASEPEMSPAVVGLSTQEIARRASPSTLSLRCGSKTGSGFFVEPELALTNEHVVCPPGTLMTVVLPDGRQLLGETLKSDAELDIATVRVVGAKAPPLPLGDVTRLEPGDPLVFIGSPKGLDFTVHEGKVGFVGRHYLGTGYVQFNASVNPGNSGGPLLNGRGEVVGVVSLKIENADGLGLALPIPYASKLISVPVTPEATARWEALLARVARDEAQEVQRFQSEPAQPMLLSVRSVDKVGLVALLIERFDTPPTRVRRRMVLEAGGATCMLDAEFDYWRPMRESLGVDEDSRRLRWFVARGLTDGVHVGAARLPVEDCPLQGAGSAWLTVGPGDAGSERFEVLLKDVQAARDSWSLNKGGIKMWEQFLEQKRKQEARSREDAERWRSSFSKARARVARFEEEQTSLRREEAEGKAVAQRQREVEAELKLASEQLAELERYATQKQVPKEWRQ